MNPSYYKKYFDIERNHWWFKARSAIISDYIFHRIVNAPNQIKILNIGVATGASTLMLSSFGSVESIEYNQECIDFIKDRVNFKIIQGDILNLPFGDNQFDLVCAFDVIEHVEFDTKARDELIRVCKPCGSILITVPALMTLWSKHDLINHHYRRYNKKMLLSLFSESDQKGIIQFCSYFNFFLFPIILIARKIQNLIKPLRHNEKLKSDFETFQANGLHNLLFNIFKSERLFLIKGIRLPIGVSLILQYKKINFHS
jgi:SAM-dependent methyltransferase